VTIWLPARGARPGKLGSGLLVGPLAPGTAGLGREDETLAEARWHQLPRSLVENPAGRMGGPHLGNLARNRIRTRVIRGL